MTDLRVFSFGGGVDSHAVIVLQSQGKLPKPYDYFVFANVGEDSKSPDTLTYIKQNTLSFCEEFGIKFIEVQKERDGQPETLRQAIVRSPHSVIIPAFTRRNGGKLHRNCTTDFKITVVAKWIKQQGYRTAVIGLGIAVDELERVRSTDWYDEDGIKKQREYPLVELRLSRQDCLNIIASSGLPEPPPSKCKWCPLNSRADWQRLKQYPDRWQDALEVERIINSKSTALTAKHVFLHRDGVPLEQAVADQMGLFPDETEADCDSGYCMT